MSLGDGALAWGERHWVKMLEGSLYPAYGVAPGTPLADLPALLQVIRRIHQAAWGQ